MGKDRFWPGNHGRVHSCRKTVLYSVWVYYAIPTCMKQQQTRPHQPSKKISRYPFSDFSKLGPGSIAFMLGRTTYAKSVLVDSLDLLPSAASGNRWQ